MIYPVRVYRKRTYFDGNVVRDSIDAEIEANTLNEALQLAETTTVFPHEARDEIGHEVSPIAFPREVIA